MRKHNRTLIILIVPLLLEGCFGLFDSGSDNIIEDYDVMWIDLHEQRALYKKVQLVPPYVFAVGHNSKFIFAKQHPLLPNSLERINRSLVNYYIIQLTKDDFQEKPTYGPMTKEVFEVQCAKLGISNIEFDMNYSTDLN